MIFKGFKFGMLLQLAIGPVCVFIFQLATLHGFFGAEAGVLGVVLIDGLYILAAILGIGAVIEKYKIELGVKTFGAIVLFIFGLSTILGLFNINLIPSLNAFSAFHSSSYFLQTVVLTISNPLTIIFWAGVFSSKIAENSMNIKEVYSFGFGAVLSTLFFLSLIAVIGSFTKTFLSVTSMKALNLIVGMLLIYFSLKMVIKRNKSKS